MTEKSLMRAELMRSSRQKSDAKQADLSVGSKNFIGSLNVLEALRVLRKIFNNCYGVRRRIFFQICGNDRAVRFGFAEDKTPIIF